MRCLIVGAAALGMAMLSNVQATHSRDRSSLLQGWFGGDPAGGLASNPAAGATRGTPASSSPQGHEAAAGVANDEALREIAPPSDAYAAARAVEDEAARPAARPQAVSIVGQAGADSAALTSGRADTRGTGPALSGPSPSSGADQAARLAADQEAAEQATVHAALEPTPPPHGTGAGPQFSPPPFSATGHVDGAHLLPGPRPGNGLESFLSGRSPVLPGADDVAQAIGLHPAVQSPVPEPESWAMAAAGVLMVMTAARRRRITAG